MRSALRENLRVILSVALTGVPRRIRKAYSERSVAVSEPAKTTIVAGLIEALDRHFDVQENPEPPLAPPLGSGGQRDDED